MKPERSNKGKCADFLVEVAQTAFLTIAGKSNPDALDDGARALYEALTVGDLLYKLENADFLDAHRSERDAFGNPVLARAEYGDGTKQSITFFETFFGQSDKEKAQTAVHEGLHLIFRFGDKDLAKAAGVYKEDRSASRDFHNKLRDKCK